MHLSSQSYPTRFGEHFALTVARTTPDCSNTPSASVQRAPRSRYPTTDFPVQYSRNWNIEPENRQQDTMSPNDRMCLRIAPQLNQFAESIALPCSVTPRNKTHYSLRFELKNRPLGLFLPQAQYSYQTSRNDCLPVWYTTLEATSSTSPKKPTPYNSL